MTRIFLLLSFGVSLVCSDFEHARAQENEQPRTFTLIGDEFLNRGERNEFPEPDDLVLLAEGDVAFPGFANRPQRARLWQSVASKSGLYLSGESPECLSELIVESSTSQSSERYIVRHDETGECNSTNTFINADSIAMPPCRDGESECELHVEIRGMASMAGTQVEDVVLYAGTLKMNQKFAEQMATRFATWSKKERSRAAVAADVSPAEPIDLPLLYTGVLTGTDGAEHPIRLYLDGTASSNDYHLVLYESDSGCASRYSAPVRQTVDGMAWRLYVEEGTPSYGQECDEGARINAWRELSAELSTLMAEQMLKWVGPLRVDRSGQDKFRVTMMVQESFRLKSTPYQSVFDGVLESASETDVFKVRTPATGIESPEGLYRVHNSSITRYRVVRFERGSYEVESTLIESSPSLAKIPRGALMTRGRWIPSRQTFSQQAHKYPQVSGCGNWGYSYGHTLVPLGENAKGVWIVSNAPIGRTCMTDKVDTSTCKTTCVRWSDDPVYHDSKSYYVNDLRLARQLFDGMTKWTTEKHGTWENAPSGQSSRPGVSALDGDECWPYSCFDKRMREIVDNFVIDQW